MASDQIRQTGREAVIFWTVIILFVICWPSEVTVKSEGWGL
jgi:hypothetical protein